MEIYEINKEYNNIKQHFLLLSQQIDLDNINTRIKAIEQLEKANNFWDDNKKAMQLLQEKQSLVTTLNNLTTITNKIDDFQVLLEMFYNQELDLNTLNDEYLNLEQEFHEWEINILLNDEYDHGDLYLEIHPGAGGTESQDWASMIMDMYLRYCKKHHFKVNIIDLQSADVGIKSVLIEIKGLNAYGLLKGETGIHRLVRISPFDSNKKRHTSFCSVKTMPVIDDNIDIDINEKDLKIDRFRSSGAGGQSVNTTDSAIRITHLPTGIVVACQNERSQLQNKNQALKILKIKLWELEKAKQKDLQSAFNNTEFNGWGSQKRSYVMHPYKLVKDAISGYESAKVEQILNGEIEDLLYYNLVSHKKD